MYVCKYINMHKLYQVRSILCTYPAIRLSNAYQNIQALRQRIYIIGAFNYIRTTVLLTVLAVLIAIQ
jgi:hypothetical protein